MIPLPQCRRNSPSKDGWPLACADEGCGEFEPREAVDG